MIFGVVVGIDIVNNTKAYRVLLANCKKNNQKDTMFNWQFKCEMMNDEMILNSFKKGMKWLNITLNKNGQIKGSSGDLRRFNNNKSGHRPFVIISQISNSNGKIIGYKLASYDGNVKNIPIKKIVAFGSMLTKQGDIPVQNAMYIPEDENRSAHFKSYPNRPFIEEVVQVNSSEYADKRRINAVANEKTLVKPEQIYTKDQLKQLKLGKNKGVDIRIYANPKLSAGQMKMLRKGLEANVNVRPFAFPDYDENVMKFYVVELACKADIRSYLNPKYSLDQLGELSLAAEEGLDISKLSDPSLSAKKMGEIRERLRAGLFKEMEVDGKMQMVI